MTNNNNNPLQQFLPPVRSWFETRFGQPTAPQAQGWGPIQRGDHTLILAPTGSGKTLAAFLWGIDRIYHALDDAKGKQDPGVILLYISPLKALNNDIYRNLRDPLAGIQQTAQEQGIELPEIRTAVRSGDTPQRERQSMVRRPPHVLITTPESIYLMLTSPKAREIFSTVRSVIVDEIHTLAGNKRGVHLSLSLERLAHLVPHPVQRIGLSATIQPLDEVARFLGGSAWQGEGEDRVLQPRPVTVINAGYRKPLDLEVVSVVDDFHNLPGESIWPSIIPQVLSDIRTHETTLIFTNNRRLAERTADRLNEQIYAEAEGMPTGLIADGVAKGLGILAAGNGEHAGPIRVHHGSVSKQTRLELEKQLKRGDLPALVGTSSLELGIDIGNIDLVVQLQSPKSVAQGLQRVGRSGHLVGQTSKGRIYPTYREDVVESAAIAGGMLTGDVEPTFTPRRPLDVLAQQIVAMVSIEAWDVQSLFDVLRCAYAYNDLTWRALEVTLGMLAGRYPSQAYRELRARLSWDQVNQQLAALPGSRLLALTNGGTIPNSGAFSAYLTDGKTKLGELDEEFVFETRIGDTMMLGSQVWRVVDLTDDRVIVTEAPGATPRMPFWHGDLPWRPYELGKRVGAFRREVSARLGRLRSELALSSFRELAAHREHPAVIQELEWLNETYALDKLSAWHTLAYLGDQLEQAGAISSDQLILVEVFDDALGDPRMVVHSPFGGRVNGPWGLALTAALRERTGIEVESETNDDGILLRLLDAEAEFPLDLITDLGPAAARERILRELPESAVFGTRFRQNAARALLLPGLGRGKRTPFWLQRLRARDLLQVVKHFDDFPIVAETYRDCLQDVMDMPHLEEVLAAIQRGDIRVEVTVSRTPSPVARSLLYDFINTRMYEQDTPRAEKQIQMLAVNRDLLQDLLKDVALDDLLRPEAITEVQAHLQRTAPSNRVRTAEELAVLLQQMGDLSPVEVAQRCTVDPASWISYLTGFERVIGMDIPTVDKPHFRWVAADYRDLYECAFGLTACTDGEINAARRAILQRFLGYAGPVTLDAVMHRYAFPVDWLEAELDRLIEEREVVHGHFTPQGDAATGTPPEYVDRRILEQIHRRTMGILRKEVQPVPYTVYADFLARWQHLHPETRITGEGALVKALQQLRASPVVGKTWEQDVLPLRLAHYEAADLDSQCRSGDLIWLGAGGTDPRRGKFTFLFRGEGNVFLDPAPETPETLTGDALVIYGFLKSEGAVYFTDICEALDMKAGDVEQALIELVMAGLVTNDSIATMRKLVQYGASTVIAHNRDNGMVSSLEAELAAKRTDLGVRSQHVSHQQNRSRYHSAKQRVRQRLEKQARPAWEGRWSPVHRFRVMGKAVPLAERIARQTRQLLNRYGVVTRASLESESSSMQWPLIYQHLKRMEMRGEVRRGYFIQGLGGVQFALPDVVEQLRALRDAQDADDVYLVLNACDPANLYGPALDPDLQHELRDTVTFARVPTTWFVQQRGLPILVASNSGRAIRTAPGAAEDQIIPALQVMFTHLLRFERQVTIESWNDEAVLESSAVTWLESTGCHRDYLSMVKT